MSSDLVSIGSIKPIYKVSGSISGYEIELFHNGLKEHKIIKARDELVIKNKATLQLSAWFEKWEKQNQKQKLLLGKLQANQSADASSSEAQKLLEEAHSILISGINTKCQIPWSKLKSQDTFKFANERQFSGVVFDSITCKPLRATCLIGQPEPQKNAFQPKFNLLEKLLPFLRSKKNLVSTVSFESALSHWKRKTEEINKLNLKAIENFNAAEQAYSQALDEFNNKISEENKKISELKIRYKQKDPSSVTSIVELVLSESKYPSWLNKDCLTAYNPETDLLVIDFVLPKIDDIPNISKITYVASKNELRTSYLKNAERDKLYELILFQLALRSIHEIF